MRSFKIGKLMGISLELHSTFIWLILLIIIFLAILDPFALIPSLILLFFLFLSVFIHELFHSIVAVSKGIKVEKIILLPIGGISLTEEMPEKAVDEFQIAIAGPLFNFAMVFLIVFLVSTFPFLPWPWHIFSGVEVTIEELNNAIMLFPLFGLFWVNLILGVFNLLPALPLDGGRLFRSLLSWKIGFNKATHIASKVSSFFAILLFLIGLLGANIILVIIAVFIYLGASQENEVVVVKETLRGVDLSKIINRKPIILDSKMSLEEAFSIMEKRNKTAFLVKIGRGFGFIAVEMLKDIERSKWPATKLGKIAKKLPLMKLSDGSAKIMTTILSKGYPFIPIREKGAFIGIIEESEMNKVYKLTKLIKRA